MYRVQQLALAATAVTLVLASTLFLVAGGDRALAVAPGNEHFDRTWARTDKPVLDGLVSRTWMWGPEAISELIAEPYADAPGGFRWVQYFDKSRMEITSDPDVAPSSPWYVTNGLLVNELMTGQMQVGDEQFASFPPAQENVAGDADDPTGPTYATFGTLRDLPPLADNALVIQRVDRNGNVTADSSLAAYGVTAAQRVTMPGLDHQLASPFLAFMQSQGTIYVNGAFVTDRLFPDDFYATGLPVTEAYWAHVKIEGIYQDVLIQCFERRCLTYTPDNPPGWLVEAGNVGLHYRAWRTEHEQTGDIPTPTFTPTPTSTPRPNSTATLTLTPTNTPILFPTATNTPIVVPTATRTPTPRPTATRTPTQLPTATQTSGNQAACLNAEEAAFLNLINNYRQQNGLQALQVSRALNIASYKHSLDMGTRGYFSHTSPDGVGPRQRMTAEGYTYNTAWGENIAAGGSYATAQGAFNGWKNSSGHNANMLNASFKVIGIGFAVVGGSPYTNYWTTNFGGYIDAAPGC